ncbi:MAG: T9SS type A sorting domain-containing protein [Chlorobi bacterium]|nr:T9SS type A sorting domain-containing protein [Chlorobiota bacterium]
MDNSGNAFVIGYTGSTDYPVTTGAYDKNFNGGSDVFVSMLNPSGSDLVYSTFIGGSSSDIGNCIAIDNSGDAFVTGYTGSTDFPTTNGAYDESHNGNNDVFVSMLNPAGSDLVYSTFIGGSGNDSGVGIAIDNSGNTFIAGFTKSANYPVTTGAYDESLNGGYYDVFVTKLFDALLPVELTSFTAVSTGSATNKISVVLNWTTATEVNNFGFEIARAIDINPASSNNDYAGTRWKTIGFVEGRGNSNSPKEYSFIDASLSISGTVQYRLKQIDTNGSFEYSDIVEIEIGLPEKFELFQNYPNPFNPSTTINYQIPKDGFVNITVYNSLGQEIGILLNENQTSGKYSIRFNANNLPSGLYIYRLQSGEFSSERKMILAK